MGFAEGKGKLEEIKEEGWWSGVRVGSQLTKVAMMSINQLIIIGIMRRIWSFKSWTNFAITTLGVSAIGLVYRSMTN